jgi:signal transduction histidine kinase
MWYPVPYNLRLPYRKNNLTFNFHAVSLSGHDQLRYRYVMNGLDAPWSTWSPVTSVTYSALPPGKYDFVVQCMADGDTSVKELHYSFEIIAPFHKTNLFTFLVLAAFMLLGISLQYAANRRKQNRLRLLEKLRNEEQDKVRARTAEDFHDEVGNKLTRINVLTNILKTRIEKPAPELFRIIEQIQDNTAQLYSGTRDILWSLQPANGNLYEILNRIRDVGVELFQHTEIEFRFPTLDERFRQFRLPLDVSRNLTMIFKEALNNCLKYAEATSVHMDVVLKDQDTLQLKLTDNGKGFDMHSVRKGHGITNMHVRAERIKGRLYIDSNGDNGTIITLTFRLPVTADKKSRYGRDKKHKNDSEL